MRSLRTIADCIGLKNDFQVVQDFFGYTTGAPQEISLLRQLKLMKGFHVDINVIRVGSESFTEADDEEIDAAIAFMRDTYATVNFGVGRVRQFFISTDDANGRDHIGSDDEAEDLTHEWSVNNDALDVFFVRTYAGSTVGSAPLDGTWDKDANGPMTGVVLAIEGSPTVTGFVLAKDVCRYLGVEPSENKNNLMFATVPNGGNITHEQREMMTQGSFVQGGCGWTYILQLSGGGGPFWPWEF